MTERNKLRQQFDQKRLDRDILIRQRKAEMYQQDERFLALELAHRDLIAELTIAGLEAGLSDESLDQELATRHESFYDEQAKLLLEHDKPEDYFQPGFDCNDCLDTGRLGQDDCHCFKQALAQSLYQEQSLLDETRSLANWTSDIFTGEQRSNAEAIYEAMIHYVDTLEEHPGLSLIFEGVPGVGKTYLSSALAGSLAAKGYHVIYQTAPDLFDVDYSKKREHTARLRSCDMLIIDDLGKEPLNDYVRSELFSLINHRINTKRSFLISTNLTPPQLKKRYQDDIFNRLIAVCENHVFLGPEVRSQSSRFR